MKKYIVSFLSFFLGCALASGAFAQRSSSCDDTSEAGKTTIAELRDLQGNVLVSDKEGVTSALIGQRVANKSRVTTTAKAGVVVSFDCGCDVTLKENQRFDVELPRGCAALLASVQPVPVTAALGAAPVTGSTAGLLTVGAVGVGGLILLRQSRNVSPN